MANVNITQIKTLLQGVGPKTVVHIHADVLLQILTAYKSNSGSDASPTQATGRQNPTAVDLTGY